MTMMHDPFPIRPFSSMSEENSKRLASHLSKLPPFDELTDVSSFVCPYTPEDNMLTELICLSIDNILSP
jgi:hypothetical protein